MKKPPIVIPAKDCSSVIFKDSSLIPEIIEAFDEANLFYSRQGDDDVEAILTYNFKRKQWETGRYVGDLFFTANKKEYHFRIEPRFGNVFLLNLFEEAYNIRIPRSQSEFKKKFNSDLWIKRLISFIWVQKLAKANKHGLPFKQNKLIHYGATIKGRLNISKSKISLFTSGNVVSEETIKELDGTVAQILKKAHQILETYYHFRAYKAIPQNASEAIQILKTIPKSYSIINKNSFNRIFYKDIYSSYRDVVNLSWLIINNRILSVRSQNQDTKKGFSVFLDIAELWELYLLNILKKTLGIKGWNVYSSQFEIYKHKAFQRKIIPDIIIEKGNTVLIFDAKYKRMEFDKFDYDRTDFFQIHTYTFFKSLGKKVVCAGLLYPLSKYFDTVSIEKNTDSIFGEAKNEMLFKIDGIDFSGIKESLSFDEQRDIIKKREHEFLNRIQILVAKYQ
jgi:5-methylcytosine-specific restriction enzyme subunit McrC